MNSISGCYIILLLILVGSCLTQSQSICQSASNCDECMRIGPECHWCEDQNFTLSGRLVRARCDDLSALKTTCKSIRYLNSSSNIVDNENFGSTTQVRPQKVKLSLRPGQKRSFQVTVKPAEDFPVDIYFLNDLSSSMAEDLENLRKLAEDIARAIGNITRNYRLGFGAFIDKPTPPFAFYTEDYTTFPCQKYETNCQYRPSFGFAHIFDFSSNTTQFSSAIAAQRSSADIDQAEGCFDALMQAVVCENELKWKPKKAARRLIILVTDAEPKLAGEGRLANILEPNDGKCYLRHRVVENNTEQYFYRTAEMDYPSISQLRHVMKEQDVAPILAVTESVLPIYKLIAQQWADLGSAAEALTNKSKNIVNLVRDNYNRIATTIALRDEAPPYLELTYQVDETTCTKPASVVSNSECADVKLNQSIIFNVDAKLKFCPNPLPKDPTVRIRIAGFGEVVLDLEYLCQCDCPVEIKSDKCNGVGNYKCGICECEQGHFGQVCQCDASLVSHNDTSQCVDPNNPKETCNGDGRCICGQCECFPQESPKVISGDYCQCRNFGCPKLNPNDVEECGGPSRGECKCGQCVCLEPYTGINCGQIHCETLMNRTCRQNGIECNGHGKCSNCANCTCDAGYAGNYCDLCITTDCKCSTVNASCLMHHLENKTTSLEDCSQHQFIPVKNETFDVSCPVDFGQCKTRYNFTSVDMHNTTMVWTYYENHQCVQPISNPDDDTDNLAIILGIIAAILILGLLLLLLWKLLVTLHDKKEYAKFEKAANDSHWEKDGNPIYREPNQQFVNPAFSGSS